MPDLQNFEAVVTRLVEASTSGERDLHVWDLITDWALDPDTTTERHSLASELAAVGYELPAETISRHLWRLGAEVGRSQLTIQDTRTVFLTAALCTATSARIKEMHSATASAG